MDAIITTEDIQKAFKEWDIDSNGFLTFNEVKAALEKDGCQCTEEEIKEYFNCVDTTGDNQISLEEFEAGFKKFPIRDLHKMCSVRAAGYKYLFEEACTDPDNKEFLSLEELSEALEKGGFDMSNGQILTYFNKVDKSADGKISQKEFLVAMQQLPADDYKKAMMKNLFRKLDKDGSKTLDKKELTVLCSEKFGVDEKELDKVMDQMDADKDGNISYEEFLNHFCKESS